MTIYRVEQSLTYIYQVLADTPEEAAQIVRDGDSHGSCESATIQKVTHANSDDWDAKDLRADLTCQTCGKTMTPKYQLPTCHDCSMAELRERLTK